VEHTEYPVSMRHAVGGQCVVALGALLFAPGCCELHALLTLQDCHRSIYYDAQQVVAEVVGSHARPL